jgi:hypothetical protein
VNVYVYVYVSATVPLGTAVVCPNAEHVPGALWKNILRDLEADFLHLSHGPQLLFCVHFLSRFRCYFGCQKS